MNLLCEIVSSSNMADLLNEKIYSDRFDDECRVIEKLQQADNIIFAHKIKSIIETFEVPFFIRGSAGGSLVLYILGFTNVDPVKNNILFERFINEFRDTLGDIDFDLPRTMRNTILNHVYKKLAKENIYIGRLCTRVNYKQNSAIREIIRRLGTRENIPAEIIKCSESLTSFLQSRQMDVEKILTEAKKIEGTLRFVSKHVGGIVVLNPTESYMMPKKINTDDVPLVNLDKNDVDRQKRFKVDLLSNTALDILHEIYPSVSLNEQNYPYKQEVFDMIGQGKTLGIVFGESPLIISVFKMYHTKYKITSVKDIAKCISMIRPMGRGQGKNSDLIFDDDWITELSKILNVSYSEADSQRRKLSKGDPNVIQHLKNKVSVKKLKQLLQIKKYGFCKAHAFNYAQLIYCQAYAKMYNPEKFYCAVLNSLNERMYEDFVYFLEIVKSNIKVFACKKKDTYKVIINKNNQKVIMPTTGIQTRLFPLSCKQEYDCFGGFTTLKNIHELNGIIACKRAWKNCVFQTILYNGELENEVFENFFFSFYCK